MTNAELISKIKGEIERLKEEAYNSILPDEPKYRTHYKVGKKELCEELLSFLSTLESEKPMNLDEEIDNYFKHWTEDEYTGAACHYQYVNLNDCRGIARHFAKWGAEHRGSSEIPKDLDEAAEKYQDDHTIQRYAGGRLLAPEFDVTIKEVFIAGAEWQADHTLLPEDTVLFNKGVEEGKRLMMEDAVEGRINPFGFHNAISTKDPAFTEVLDKLKPCDKVRVIIVKEDEK